MLGDAPTLFPTMHLANTLTIEPIVSCKGKPSQPPTSAPSLFPSQTPSDAPSYAPSNYASFSPTQYPSYYPTTNLSHVPRISPPTKTLHKHQ